MKKRRAFARRFFFIDALPYIYASITLLTSKTECYE